MMSLYLGNLLKATRKDSCGSGVKNKKYIKVTIILLLGIVTMLYLDIREVGTINSAKGIQNIFVDSVSSKLVLNHGSTYEKDSLYVLSYTSKYVIIVVKLNNQKSINNEDVQIQIKRSISDFWFSYFSVELGSMGRIMKKDISSIRDIDMLFIEQGVKLNSDTSKEFVFRTKKFAIGNKQNGPELIFDFYDNKKNVEFSIGRFNKSTFLFVLFSNDETEPATSLLPSIIQSEVLAPAAVQRGN